ncbi:hypothetical protein Y032_0023g730 [Ancylostoma ceylanicum]|uniref:Uncharacterized protein n=1 Tax=Ancylostoma ceylanicum TaxID=53326 RepID=A0A016UZA1_9BILA|nr:hypothetical protein Y032_0023g730 [Ancylostoma ceylanicum]
MIDGLRVRFHSIEPAESRRDLLDPLTWACSLCILRPGPAAILHSWDPYIVPKRTVNHVRLISAGQFLW